MSDIYRTQESKNQIENLLLGKPLIDFVDIKANSEDEYVHKIKNFITSIKSDIRFKFIIDNLEQIINYIYAINAYQSQTKDINIYLESVIHKNILNFIEIKYIN